MPDFLDQSSEVEQQTLLNHLEHQKARAAAAIKIAANGVCQNPRCAEEFEPGDNRIFCDSRCAVEHQRLNRNT